jgi:hypothetical protein
MLRTFCQPRFRTFIARLLVAFMACTAIASAADHHVIHGQVGHESHALAHISGSGTLEKAGAEHDRHAHPFYYFTAVLALEGFAVERGADVLAARSSAHYRTRVPAVPDHPPKDVVS